jgi:hypothetical protein
MEEQAEDDNCPGGKFTKTWAQIQDNEKPNDTMVKMELDEDLRGIGLSKRKYLKLLLAKMSALKIKYGIPIADTKNCAVILRDGQKDYVEVMTITSTVITATKKREATPQEMVDAIHKQWQFQSNRERTSKNIGNDEHKKSPTDVNDEEKHCYEPSSRNHTRKQPKEQEEQGRDVSGHV